MDSDKAVRIKTQSRIHKVARLTIAGLSDIRIAACVGLTTAGLSNLKQRDEYKHLVAELLAGTVTRWDEELAKDVSALHQEFAVGVPVAMRTLLDTVMQKKDLKASLEAAKEILDRDPKQAFSKKPVVQLDDPNRPSIPEAILKSMSIEADIVAAQSAVVMPKEKVN